MLFWSYFTLQGIGMLWFKEREREGVSPWKHIRRLGISSLVLLLLRWVMTPEPGFGIMFGVVIDIEACFFGVILPCKE
jgi:hypothetical protein